MIIELEEMIWLICIDLVVGRGSETQLQVSTQLKHTRVSFNPYSAGIDFRRHNLTSANVRIWRLKSIPAL